MQEPLSVVEFSDLPDNFIRQARKTVGNYSVPIIINGRLCGSGTLIRCGDTHGILTAHHVTERLNFTANSDQVLYVSVADFAHHLTFEMRKLSSIVIAKPASPESGPDLACILFPPSTPLGEIKARMSFLDISAASETKLRESLKDDGLWIISGFPDQLVAPYSSPRNTRAVCFPRIALGIGALERSELGKFDYLEAVVDCPVQRWNLSSFGGMSGCGVWRLPIYRDCDANEFHYRDCYFAGVAFNESAVIDQTRRLRCHGGQSIFVRALKSLGATGV